MCLLRIAVQAKGRLFEETMALLEESDIKLSTTKRTLLVQSSNFPVEVLFLRDDDIPQSVATGVADLGIVGENEFVEKGEDAEVIKRLGFSKCRLSLAMPKDIDYPGVEWFNGKKIATSYPVILENYMKTKGVNAEVHVITGSVEVAPGIGLADAIFDIVSSGSTLVSNRLKEVEVVMKSEALLIGNKNMCDEKKEILNELLFRMNAVKTAEDKKYVLMNAPKEGEQPRSFSFKKPLALESFLKRHPEIEEIEICTNNDFAGRWAAEHLEKAYQGKYRMVKNLPEKEGCDYADLAKERYEKQAARQRAACSR